MIKAILTIIFIRSVVCSNQPSYSFLGTGYNLKHGNPDGPSIYTVEMDQGLRPTRYVWIPRHWQSYHYNAAGQQEYSGYSAVGCPTLASCALFDGRITKRYVVDGNTWSTQYRNQIGDKFTFEVGDNFWSSMPLEHLDAFREVKELVMEKNFTMVTEEIWNARAEATFEITDRTVYVSERFKKDLCSAYAGINNNQTEAFPKFFERWGTHVITEVTLGYKEVTRHLLRREDFFEYGLKRANIEYNEGSLKSPEISKIIESLKNTGFAKIQYWDTHKTNKLKFGDETLPLIPLRIRLVPAYEIVDHSCERSKNVDKTIWRNALKNYLQSD